MNRPTSYSICVTSHESNDFESSLSQVADILINEFVEKRRS